MFAKLPLVTLVILSNLTRLTAVVCMEVRYEAKVTRDFSLFLPFRDSLSSLRSSLSFAKKIFKKNLGDQGRCLKDDDDDETLISNKYANTI